MTSAFPSDLKPNSVTGKAGGGLVDTGNSSFLTDFDKTGPGTIDTDEVDPVADLRPVCPNCHAVIHLGGACRTIEEVRRLLKSAVPN